jgi:protein subunit release factor A
MNQEFSTDITNLIVHAKELYQLAKRYNNLQFLFSAFDKYLAFSESLKLLYRTNNNDSNQRIKRISNKDYVSITNVVFLISTERTELLTHPDDIKLLKAIIE